MINANGGIPIYSKYETINFEGVFNFVKMPDTENSFKKRGEEQSEKNTYRRDQGMCKRKYLPMYGVCASNERNENLWQKTI